MCGRLKAAVPALLFASPVIWSRIFKLLENNGGGDDGDHDDGDDDDDTVSVTGSYYISHLKYSELVL